MKKIKLGDIFKTTSGSTPLTSDRSFYDYGTISWLTSGEVGQGKITFTKNFITQKALEETSVKMLPKHSVVIAMYGATVGEIGILDFETTTNQAVCGILPNKEQADPFYVYYHLLNRKKELINLASGSARTNISQKVIQDFELYLPNIKTQTAIAHVLSSLDDKIELNNKINKELENMAKTIYDYWFVQNADRRWERKRVGDILRKYTDNSLHIDTKNIYKTEKYPVITQDVGDLIKGYTNEENPIIDLPAIIFGDHSCTLRFLNFPFFRGADGTQLLYFENEETTVYAYFCLEQIIPFLTNFGKYERHFKYLKDFEIIVPSTPILQKFNKIVSPLFSTIIKNRQENICLAQQRDFLLPLLMGGEVGVG